MKTNNIDFHENDIIALCETFHSKPASIEGFNVIEVLAQKGQGRGRPVGGLILATKSAIQAQVVSVSQVHIHAVLPNIRTHVVSTYFAPDTDVDEISLSIADILRNIPSGEDTILLGDFNCRIDATSRGKDLEEALGQWDLLLHSDPKLPTYEQLTSNGTRSSSIDLMFSNTNRFVSSTINEDTSGLHRKHKKVKSIFKMKSNFCGLKTTTTKRELDQSLLPPNVTDRVQELLTNACLDEAVAFVNDSIKQATVKVSVRKPNRPWFNSALTSLRRECHQLNRLAKMDQQYYPIYAERRREYKKAITTERAEYEDEGYRRKYALADQDPWPVFRKKYAKSNTTIPLKIAKDHFLNLLSRNPPDFSDLPGNSSLTTSEAVQPISLDEMLAAITSAPNRKAAGIDGIANEHLKQAIPILLPSFAAIFNYCLDNSIIPSQWTKSALFLLYKGKGSIDQATNYRGICIQSTLFKLFTKVIKNRLQDKLESQLSHSQFGFRRGRSTCDAVSKVIGSIQDGLSRRGKKYAAFVDFAKAFDSVDRALLVKKLRHRFKLNERYIRVIQSVLASNTLYLNHKKCSNCDSVHGPVAEVTQTIGVLQGDSLSPFLFILFIDDIAEELEPFGSEVFLYADDLVILTDDHTQLQRSLDALTSWTHKNHMAVNVSKTKVMKFRNGGRFAKYDKFTYDSKELEIVSDYTYLGITLQPKLCFSNHIKRVKLKATMATIRHLAHIGRVSLPVVKQVFDSCIRPILFYGMSAISAFLKSQHLIDLDVVKNKFLKSALCLPPTTGNETVYLLCNTKRVGEELKSKNYPLNDTEWENYQAKIEESRQRHAETVTNIDSLDNEWMLPNKERHFIMGTAIHGFHYCLCLNESFHKSSTECLCRYCHQTADHPSHLSTCTFFGNSTLFERYKLVHSDWAKRKSAR